ncbi:hypothetical protein HNP52_004268 [Sphingomonas kyeonggiensis]|uniref:DUF3617 family protein n=1 Tax=Sphingomonas kyeonggiensis TaxID=1268553 RepID=A0A7W7NUL6_9SPHN|nr:hypothetical protein [Sphingomonas kyeonggiensis]MBB4841171.1 hypothetical protein [Sphingomonas kyeonggiensis]
MKSRLFVVAAVLALSACGSSNKEASAPGGDDTAEPGAAGEIVPVPAGGLFELPAGLWERKVTALSGKPMPVERICIADSVRARVIPLTEVRPFLSDCKLLEQSEKTMFGVIFRLQCSKPKATEVGGNITFKDGALTTALTIANGGTTPADPLPSNATIVSRRIGDCPAGMKPGDTADQGGRITGSIAG